MKRAYVLDVLFWKRDDRGEPAFGPEPRDEPLDYLRDLAVRRGLPHREASAWAAKAHAQGMRKGADDGG
jgi:hypothetical protein